MVVKLNSSRRPSLARGTPVSPIHFRNHTVRLQRKLGVGSPLSIIEGEHSRGFSNREEHHLMVCQNQIYRKIFEPFFDQKNVGIQRQANRSAKVYKHEGQMTATDSSCLSNGPRQSV